MKILLSILFTVLISCTFAQGEAEKDSKPFAKTSNKYYVGANVSPIFLAALGADRWQSEWKLGYKQRLGKKNHFFRLSYSYLPPRLSYNGLYGYYRYDQRQTYAINDSMDWQVGTFKNVDNKHHLKLGYEYQFMVGEKRNVSINMGNDFILGFRGGKLFYMNDTIIHNGSTNPFPEVISDVTVQSRAQVYFGTSPYIALGIPLKKRFELTFEMAFDIYSLPYLPNDFAFQSRTVNVNYQPSVMISYRFDEDVARNKTRTKGKER